MAGAEAGTDSSRSISAAHALALSPVAVPAETPFRERQLFATTISSCRDACALPGGRSPTARLALAARIFGGE
jgi:hypothetical protein